MSELQPGELPKSDATPRRPHALARFGGPIVLLALVFIVLGCGEIHAGEAIASG